MNLRSIDKAFKNLITNWQKQPKEYRHKYRTYKSRFLNLSGNQTKKVGQDKMREMLLKAGYKEEWKLKP